MLSCMRLDIDKEVIEEGTRDTDREIKKKCIQALLEMPVLDKYRYDSENVQNAEKAYKS